ncbi:MAG TPA: MFS transporter, partial [Novosphingobium sp.]
MMSRNEDPAQAAESREAVRAEWRTNWPVPIAASAAIMASLIHFGTLGVFLPGIEAETGWTRSEITFGMMLFSIVSIVASPFVGLLVDRFGARRVGLPGLILYLAAVAALSLAGLSVWGWWANWVVLGVGGALAKFNVWTAGVSQWFDRGRGMAIAAALSGTSLAGISMPALAAVALHYANWRTGYLAIAALEAVIALPLVLWCFNDPSTDKAQRAPASAPTPPVDGVARLKVLFRSRTFFGFLLICVTTFLPLSALNIHFVPLLREDGIAADAAAVLAALIGGASLAGQAASGWLLDRVPGNQVFAGFLLCGFVAAGLLSTNHSVMTGALAALVFGLLNGAGPACLAYLCSRCFDMRVYGTVLASLAGVMSLSAGLGSVLAGATFDWASSYTPFLFAAMA